MTYEDFLKAKVLAMPDMGIDIAETEINPLLKPHQKAIVRWAVKRGRAAIFAAFGLGKTIMQLEIVRLLLKHLGGCGLIICPLGVRFEFMQDAAMLGLKLTFIRSIDECDVAGLYITNYETVRENKLDPRAFTAISLDEAGCLRGFGGTKTFRQMMAYFEGSGKYRFVATATPSPNDFIELLAYSAFLDIMDVSGAKTKFFQRDSEHADELTLMPHRETDFRLFCSTWAVFLQSPADLGFDPTGYEMPKMEINWHEVPSDHMTAGMEPSGQGRLLRNAAIGLGAAAREKRDSRKIRINKMLEIVRERYGLLINFLHVKDEGTSVLRTKSGKGTCESEGLLSKAQGEIDGCTAPEDERVSVKISQGPSAETYPPTARQIQSGETREICQEPRLERATEVYSETESCQESSRQTGTASPTGVWDQSPAVSGHPHKPERQMRNLRINKIRRDQKRQTTAAPCGPLPQNKEGTWYSLSPLQSSIGPLSGQCSDSQKGDQVFDQFIIWSELNEEQHEAEAALKEIGVSVSSVYGSMGIEEKEFLMSEWRNRKTSAFLTKGSMHGAGANLQQSRHEIFLGINYKFYSFFQSIHRVYRFLQEREVIIDIIYTEAEREIRRALEEKWEKHKELMENMTEIIREYGLGTNALMEHAGRKMNIIRQESRGETWTIVNNDCIPETESMAQNSVDLILTSIPFSQQYEYSPSFRDLGHNEDNEHFWAQMDYLIPNLLKVLRPGRVAAIHVKDRITPSGLTGRGYQTVYRFSDECGNRFEKHGFGFLGRKTIVTDVVRENNQTYRLGWTEQCKDGSRMGAGMPEYLMLFRKDQTDRSNGYADQPVVKNKADYTRSRWQIDAHGFMRSNGNRQLVPSDLVGVPHERIFKLFRQDSMRQVYDFERHIELSESLERCQECRHIHIGDRKCGQCACKIAGSRLPATFMLLQPQSWHDDVWTDVARMRTLNCNQVAKNREQHICPISFDICDRVINQFSMKGETVLDPFAGLGTVPMRAVMLGRRGLGIELSADYYRDSLYYMQQAERKLSTPSLFDLLAAEEDEPEISIVHGEPVSIPANSSMGSEMLAPDQRNYKPVDRF